MKLAVSDHSHFIYPEQGSQTSPPVVAVRELTGWIGIKIMGRNFDADAKLLVCMWPHDMTNIGERGFDCGYRFRPFGLMLHISIGLLQSKLRCRQISSSVGLVNSSMHARPNKTQCKAGRQVFRYV